MVGKKMLESISPFAKRLVWIEEEEAKTLEWALVNPSTTIVARKRKVKSSFYIYKVEMGPTTKQACWA